MNSQVQEIIQFVNEGKERQELLRVFFFLNSLFLLQLLLSNFKINECNA